MPKLRALDHLVLTVTDIERTVAFYCDVLGMAAERFVPADGTVRMALRFGVQKINLHQAGAEFLPAARVPMPGAADLCFLTDGPMEDWVAHLGDRVIEGPVRRTGATGPMMSVYLRDPDGNLIEVSVMGVKSTS